MSTIINRPVLKKNDNYINGKWTVFYRTVFQVLSPLDGKVMAKAAHSAKQDIEMAVDAALKHSKLGAKLLLQNAVLSSIKLQIELKKIFLFLL